MSFDAKAWFEREYPESAEFLAKETHRVFTTLLDDYLKIASRAYAAAKKEEAQWWWDYTFGKPQSGKLGVERLQEAHDRILDAGGVASNG